MTQHNKDTEKLIGLIELGPKCQPQARRLIYGGVNPNTECLEIAIVNSHCPDFIDFLVRRGAKLTMNCVALAIEEGLEHMAKKWLTELGSTIAHDRCANCELIEALHDLIITRYFELPKLKIRKNCIYCAIRNCEFKTKDYINNESFNALKKADKKCIDLSIDFGQEDMIEPFIKKGAIINADHIRRLIVYNRSDLARLFVQENLVIPDRNCLHAAAHYKQYKLLEQWIDLGFDFSAKCIIECINDRRMMIAKKMLDILVEKQKGENP